MKFAVEKNLLFTAYLTYFSDFSSTRVCLIKIPKDYWSMWVYVWDPPAKNFTTEKLIFSQWNQVFCLSFTSLEDFFLWCVDWWNLNKKLDFSERKSVFRWWSSLQGGCPDPPPSSHIAAAVAGLLALRQPRAVPYLHDGKNSFSIELKIFL